MYRTLTLAIFGSSGWFTCRTYAFRSDTSTFHIARCLTGSLSAVKPLTAGGHSTRG
jgi:hypothetical protein